MSCCCCFFLSDVLSGRWEERERIGRAGRRCGDGKQVYDVGNIKAEREIKREREREREGAAREEALRNWGV